MFLLREGGLDTGLNKGNDWCLLQCDIIKTLRKTLVRSLRTIHKAVSEDINLSTYWDSGISERVSDLEGVHCYMRRISYAMDQDQARCNRVAERNMHALRYCLQMPLPCLSSCLTSCITIHKSLKTWYIFSGWNAYSGDLCNVLGYVVFQEFSRNAWIIVGKS